MMFYLLERRECSVQKRERLGEPSVDFKPGTIGPSFAKKTYQDVLKGMEEGKSTLGLKGIKKVTWGSLHVG